MSKIKRKITFDHNYSQNFYSKKRKLKDVKFIILHYTGMRKELKAIKKLTSNKSNVSCNYFIRSNGGIVQVVPEEYASWHAGISRWKNEKYLFWQVVPKEMLTKFDQPIIIEEEKELKISL